MSELSLENAALIERVAGVEAKGGKPFEMRPATLNRLLDAARQEGPKKAPMTMQERYRDWHRGNG